MLNEYAQTSEITLIIFFQMGTSGIKVSKSPIRQNSKSMKYNKYILIHSFFYSFDIFYLSKEKIYFVNLMN
jgi:hypothetical protein